MLDTMEKNIKIIHNDVASLVFYMQGGLNINDAYNLSITQRKIMAKIIEKEDERLRGKKNSRLI